MRLQAATGDLVRFVETGVASFAPAAEAKGITLSFRSTHDARTGQDAETWFDRDVLEKILNNLVGNALKFTPPRRHGVGSLATGTVDGGRRRISPRSSVADTGVGIPQQSCCRTSSTVSTRSTEAGRAREGIGIGLALVKELVELHYGTITDRERRRGRARRSSIRLPTGTAHLRADDDRSPTRTAHGGQPPSSEESRAVRRAMPKEPAFAADDRDRAR